MGEHTNGLSNDLAWSVERTGSSAVVALSGELDMAAAKGLQEELDGLHDEGTPAIVLDLRRLRFLDSSGLHLVERLRSRLAERDGKLTLVRGPDAVQRVFDLAGIADRFEFTDA